MSKSRGKKPQNQQAMSEPETSVVKKMNDRIPALAALYQGEKTDASYTANTTMAMLGIAVVYLVYAMSLVGNLGHGLSHGPIDWLFLLLLPFPLWIVVAHHSLLTLTLMSHGISVRILDDPLFEASVASLAIGFTAYALYSANGIVRGDVVLVHARVIEIAIATYSLLVTIVALSWIVGLRMIDKGRSEIPKHVKGSGAKAG
jgi:hypothetical protein